MKKNRFIKEFGNISTTSLYNEKWRYIWNIHSDEINYWELNELMQWLILYKDFFKDYIEEYKELPNPPKFKVWDYAVIDDKKFKKYIKIINVVINPKGRIKYNSDSFWYYAEQELRLPTKEELAKYFR